MPYLLYEILKNDISYKIVHASKFFFRTQQKQNKSAKMCRISRSFFLVHRKRVVRGGRFTTLSGGVLYHALIFILVLLMISRNRGYTVKKISRAINPQKGFITLKPVYGHDLPFNKPFFRLILPKVLYTLQIHILWYWFHGS